MVRFEISFAGFGLSRAALQRTDEVALAVAQEIQALVDLCFKAETDPWGRKWAALTDTTMDRRRGSSAQILSDTGVLRGSVFAGPEGTGAVVGTEDIRAGTHQFGAKKGAYGTMKSGAPIPWGDIPARPFMPLDPQGNLDLPVDWVESISGVIDDWVAKAL